MKVFLCTGLLLFTCIVTPYAQTSSPQVQLNEYEIELLRDSRMSQDKLNQIYSAGVTLEEYFQYPWINLNLSEKEWLSQRSAGIIKGEDYQIQQLKKNQWAVIQNFFIPGLHQFKRKQTLKGFLMAGIAAGSISLYALHKASGKTGIVGFDYPAYLALLGADLLWSSIDLGVQVNREFDNGARRFSMYPMNEVPVTAIFQLDNGISLNPVSASSL